MPQSTEERMFWQSRWTNQDTPWDLNGPHPLTQRALGLLQLHGRHIFQPNAKAYIPACGSAHDGVPLHQAGFDVVAEDIVADAIAAAQKLYASSGISCRVGDSLATLPGEVAKFDLVFDRAALCAMQPHVRQIYWNSCMSKLKPGGIFAAVLFTRMKPEFEGIQGPPFAIDIEQLPQLFSQSDAILAAEEHTCANPVGKILKETIVLVIHGKRGT